MISILILALAFIGDIFLASFIGVGFIASLNSVGTNLFFITLILVTYKEKLFKSIMIAIACGFIMDQFSVDTIYINTLVYVISVLIAKAWATRVNYTIIELFFTILSVVFVKEILLYLYYTIVVGVRLSFPVYLSTYLVYTLLFSTLFIFIGVLIKKYNIDKEIYEQRIKGKRASLSNRY